MKHEFKDTGPHNSQNMSSAKANGRFQPSKRIRVQNLSEKCGLVSAIRSDAGSIDLDSPATELMVDFTRIHAITVAGLVTVDDALEMMRTNGIRSLLVVDKQGDFCGVITAMDIMGRKPMVFANESGTRRPEVQVKDIMVPKSKLKAMARADIEQATVDDVLKMFKAINEQHLLVVDEVDSTMQISGMFSATDFRRAFGIEVVDTLMANSFSDLERVIHEKKEVI